MTVSTTRRYYIFMATHFDLQGSSSGQWYKIKGFARHVKEPWVYVEVEITGKIDRPFLARNSVFR